jgi:hypothetical protein
MLELEDDLEKAEEIPLAVARFIVEKFHEGKD